MQLQYLLLISYLLAVNKYVTVSKIDQCDNCTQLQSPADCIAFGCIWKSKTKTTSGSCESASPPPPPQPAVFPSYCQTIDKAQCSKTFGCALVEDKCTHFTGCSAYVKTTQKACQEISYMCITDGVTCTNVLECAAYSKDQCETRPILQSPFKCKLDGGTCRNYKCIEADTSLTTNFECNQWLTGCKTTGAGCIDVIPPCASYLEIFGTCYNMRGSDGNCQFNIEYNTCTARQCANADQSLFTDQQCAQYQDGCITTGRGCTATLSSCSSYYGNSISCKGLIGIEGKCSGEVYGTQCRPRKCNEQTEKQDEYCQFWKAGCVSNGQYCVDALLSCSSYDSNSFDCENIRGSDGNCDRSFISSKCLLKDCEKNSNESFKTQKECEKIQKFCKTTGQGCVAVLQNCSSYSKSPINDNNVNSCDSLYGLDGRCKAGTDQKCAARICTEAPTTYTTNYQCEDYKSGCVTTGEGCISRIVCQDIVKQVTCEGIQTCGWNSICVSNTSCAQLFTKSICENVKINNKPCKWEQYVCRDAKCNDFISNDDYVCNQLLEGCVTNGTNCVDGTNCATQFKGSQQTCQSYKAKCTNDNGAAETAACKPRTCDDPYLTQQNDKGCDNYLSGCVSKGVGCISNTAPCNSYTGTPDQCDQFKGNQINRCWNTSATGACVNKLCIQATSMIDDSTCESFLTGCLYDGNGSCVDKTASCTAYSGNQIECLNFKGNNGTNLCMAGSNNKCKPIECSDDTASQTDSDCDAFLSGCVTKGIGCIAKTAQCGSYQGTTEKCLKFLGNSGTDKCTRLEACISKKTDCASKTGVRNNNDCLLYHNDCRLKFGDTAVCMQQQNNCTDYKLSDSDNDKKQTYCNSITTQSGGLCSYNTTIIGTCQIRACNLWVNTLNNISCENYIGQASCKLNGTNCYTPQNSCGSYTIPNSITNATDKLKWCNGMFTNSVTPTKCSYDSTTSTVCSDINTCEEIILPLSTADCNFQLKDGKCQFANNKCITTQTACTSYTLAEITTQDIYCSALKSDNSGAVKQCAYISTTSISNCVDAVSIISPPIIPDPPSAITILACSAITSPTSQADCNLGTDSCKYYLGACYARVICTNYTLPTSANDADKKQMFCQNMYNSAVDEYCSYDATANNNVGGCATGKTCTGYTSIVGDNTGKRLICSKLRDKTGTACAFVDGAADCSAPTSAASCTIVTSGITVDADCDLRTILGCKKHATNATCIARAACTIATVATSSDAKIAECQTNPGPDSKYCTYPGSGNCVVAQALCSGYTGVTADTGLTTCQKKVNQKGRRCSWRTGTNCDDAPATCFGYSDLTVTDKLIYCQARIDQFGVICSWNLGTACVAAPKTCAEWNILPTSGQLEFCQARIKSNGGRCSWSAGTACQDYPSTCNQWNNLPSQEQLTFCQIRTKLDGAKCSWVVNATSCSDPPSACNGWNALPDNGKLEFCQARMKLDGGKCSWTTGATSCRNYSCEDTISPSSQADCNLTGTGCTYQPTNRICYIKQAACTSYTLPGALIILADQQSYCNNLVNTTSAKCTYITGATCAVINTCKNYNVSLLSDFEVKYATCQKAIPTSGSCTYFSGNTCTALDACKTYVGGTASSIVYDCAKQIDTNGKLCFGIGTGCVSAKCEDIIGADSIEYCEKYITGCVYYNKACYTALSTCAYATGGSNAIQFCNGIKNTSGDFCTANANTDAACKQRACNDSATLGFQTHSECKTYSSLCKSTGQGCIVATTTCANQSGFFSFCNWALDTDNKSTCAKGTLATTEAVCIKLTCELNVTATTDSECQQFHEDCLNKGFGCIHKSEPCSSYYGTKDQCQLFIGNGKKCYGDSATIKIACRDKKCTDLGKALNDSDCENLISECLFNGVGCVSKAADCVSYMGTQDTCKEFKGINGTKYCWGVSTTVINNCTDRKCSDKAGTTDQECQDFLPPIEPSTAQLCITNGTVCVDIGKPCSYFQGNNVTCSQFTAKDGPCKPSIISSATVSCTPRVCNEAPFTYSTDGQCQQYHPSCRTTGRGCKSNFSCEDYISSTSCTANPLCQLARQCRGLATKCDQLTGQGLSVCMNTPLENGNKCAGFVDINDVSGCRDFTCTDYDTSITTHQDCQLRDITCTTSGAGCVPIGECSTYISKSICEAANTIEFSKRCSWDSSIALCRQRKCSDGIFATNELCLLFLAGCWTNGKICIGPDFKCEIFKGNPKYCLKNSAGYPCLYVNGECYEYSNCTDVTNPQFNFCQAFSTQCIPSINTCRAITLCEKYVDINSCLIGVSNTKCGWLPEGKCKEFTTCNDLISPSLQACTAWGAKCSWDGVKCIDQAVCTSYFTSESCNADAVGLCQWTGTICKFRECSDYPRKTDFECVAYIVQSGLCTTDGTKCIPRASCFSYLTEAACIIDSDGNPCVFNLPIEQTTGTKSCRLKECQDIKGITNNACIGQIPNRECVSNGVNCVKKDFCARYKNKLSCKAGGLDGKCAFTPAQTLNDQNYGSCELFKSCEIANNDQDACNSKPKACKWTYITSETTSKTKCSVMDCQGIATGTICNPIPNFDDTQYSICVLVNNVCIAGDPSTISQDQCYISTFNSFTWSEAQNKCVKCKFQIVNDVNNSDHGSNNITSGYILGIIIQLIIFGIFA